MFSALTQHLAQNNNDDKNTWHLLRVYCVPGTRHPPRRPLICRSPLREAVSIIPILEIRNCSRRKEVGFGLGQPAQSLRFHIGHQAVAPHALCSNAHRALGDYYLGEHRERQASPSVTQTLREEQPIILASTSQNFQMLLGRRPQHPVGTPTASRLPACWQYRLSSLGTPIQFSPHFFEQIGEREQSRWTGAWGTRGFISHKAPGGSSRPLRSAAGAVSAGAAASQDLHRVGWSWVVAQFPTPSPWTGVSLVKGTKTGILEPEPPHTYCVTVSKSLPLSVSDSSLIKWDAGWLQSLYAL